MLWPKKVCFADDDDDDDVDDDDDEVRINFTTQSIFVFSSAEIVTTRQRIT
jgi:hypothetical protein